MEFFERDKVFSLGGYAVIGKLGQGGMGTVCLGINRSKNPPLIAIKLISAGMERDGQARARFGQEIANISRVNSPYTAKIIAAEPDATQPWYASTYISGVTLDEGMRIMDGRLPLETIADMARDITRALGAIHSHGMLHRDLKPSNIMLGEQHAHLVDFGIARHVGQYGITTEGNVIGTVQFMAPERFRNERLTAASDVFALGCVLALALTGRLPFGNPDMEPMAMAHAIMHNAPDLRGVTPGLLPLVEACLAKHPAHRPTTSQILEYLHVNLGIPSDTPGVLRLPWEIYDEAYTRTGNIPAMERMAPWCAMPEHVSPPLGHTRESFLRLMPGGPRPKTLGSPPPFRAENL